MRDLEPRQRTHPWPSTRISLIGRLQDSHDDNAWDSFVALYQPLIHNYCRSRGLQEADARDISQNVFYKVGKALPRFDYDPTKGKFRNWLGIITFREMRHYVHKAKVAVQGKGADADATFANLEAVASNWDDAFNAHILQTAFNRIRPEFDRLTWDVFTDVWVNDIAASIVAHDVNKPIGWVYKAKFRVVHRLKCELKYLAEDVAILQVHKES